VDVDIIGSGGTLSVSSGSTLLPIDLTAEGTADWIAFGLTGYQCEQGSRKASVVPLISALSSLKTSDIGVWFDSNGPYSFEDGSPDLQESNIVPNAIVGGNTPGEGLQFIVQADTTPRTLRVYAGFDGGNAQLRAYLSDGSAPTVTYSLQSNDATQTYYYLTYIDHYRRWGNYNARGNVEWRSSARAAEYNLVFAFFWHCWRPGRDSRYELWNCTGGRNLQRRYSDCFFLEFHSDCRFCTGRSKFRTDSGCKCRWSRQLTFRFHSRSQSAVSFTAIWSC
jgi:hypothetical protein